MADSVSPITIEALVSQHYDLLYRYAYRLSGSAADAEDLAQQAFLIAHQKLGQIRDPQTARSWLFTILKNVYFRSQRKHIPMPSASLQLDIESIPEDLPEEFEIDRELLQAALNDLPEEFRLVVLSFYFEECSYREIAEQLAIPLGTVMSRLSRAKSYLRARLQDNFELAAARDSAAGERQGRRS